MTAGSSPSPTGPSESNAAANLRYVALGDSYTIGTSVAAAERWPEQLVERLPQLELVANLGVNGFTSRDVIEVELPQLDAREPEVLSLLIGVNDVVQGVPEATYRRNVEEILDDLVRRVGADRVFVVTTPDYTVTPAGSDYGDPATQAAAIRRNNAINAELATARSIAVIDIYDISLEAASDRGLVASDGLHPSGAQYGRWADRIAPVVAELLAGSEP
ncbi:MAG TPA: SGNH/GDSL hydrolase family protein [Candidatus Limnocylindria bacterium]|nr:SGNH/GDSL hydrolase family protein [Candidatus Limnocylindria bacterium]